MFNENLNFLQPQFFELQHYNILTVGAVIFAVSFYNNGKNINYMNKLIA